MCICTFENVKIEWPLSPNSCQFRAQQEELPVLGCDLHDGTLDFFLLYDFHPEPLHLTARAQSGDAAQVHMRPYRIELYINGKLMDEEWPCGNPMLKRAVMVENNVNLHVSLLAENPPPQSTVLGSFENAEGWKPEQNIFVGDCMPFSHANRYHILYLKDRHHHRSKWLRGAHQWAHISSADLQHWDIHPMAVEIDDPREGSICTGSWIEYANKQYLFYTIRMCDGSSAPICRSVSEDGYHFVKDRGFSFHLSKRYTGCSARDPEIIHGADGLYHMFITSSLAERNIGCLVHLTSPNLTVWEEEPQPLYLSPDGSEPECSDYFTKDGWYYLIFSLHGKGQYLYSHKPFSDWLTPADPQIPCSSVPKMALWKDRILFAGFQGNGLYAGTLTFMEAKVQDSGQLSFQKPPEFAKDFSAIE